MTDVPLKHLCSLPPEYGLNITPDRYRDEGVRLLRTSDIATGGGVRDSGGVFLDAVDVPAEMLLRDGDLLFSRSGTLGRALLYSRDQHGEATFAGFLVRFRLRRGIDPRAIRYWSESSSFVGTVASQAIQSTISNFNADRYANLAVPGWLVEHSVAIADYIDEETARIDNVILAKRAQVQLLLARTESLVAARLDPLVRTLGEVPLKSVAELRFSNVDKKSYDGEKAVLLCNYTDVYYNRRIDGRITFMEATASPSQVAQLTLRAGDVLLTKDSETAEDIAVAALVTADLPGVVLGYHLALIRPRILDGSFLYWALQSRRVRDAFSLAASGVTRFGLRQDAVGRVPIPNVDARTAASVVAEIERAVNGADLLTSRLDHQIGLLLERRQAIITAAVTGHADIPGVAA